MKTVNAQRWGVDGRHALPPQRWGELIIKSDEPPANHRQISFSKRIFLMSAGAVPNVYIIESMVPPGWQLTVVVYLLMYSTAAVSLLKRDFTSGRVISLALFCVSWAVVELISLLISSTEAAGTVVLARLIFVGLGFTLILGTLVSSAREFDMVIKAYLIFAFIAQLAVVFDFIREGMPLGRFDFYRAHPIPVGALGAISAIVLIVLKSNQRVKTTVFWLALMPSLVVIGVSSSKGPVVSLVLTVLLLAPTILKKPKTIAWAVLSTLIVYSILLRVPQFQYVLERFQVIDEDGSTIDRLALYSAAERFIVEHPILGGGMGAPGSYPHNVYLQILVEGGFVLALLGALFTIWLAVCYVRLFRRPVPNDRYQVAFALMLASLIILLVSYTYVDLKFLYLGVGLMYCRGRSKDDTASVDESTATSGRHRSHGIDYTSGPVLGRLGTDV